MLQLSAQCKKYACDLLDQCRSSEEVIAVLNKTCEEDVDNEEYCPDEADKLTLSRLKLAIKYEQKQVGPLSTARFSRLDLSSVR